MPRNIAKPLNYDDAMRVYALKGSLSEGAEVTLNYTKRDGSASQSTGIVTEFVGAEGMDTMSVNLLTREKGMRTINLAGVTHLNGAAYRP